MTLPEILEVLMLGAAILVMCHIPNNMLSFTYEDVIDPSPIQGA